MGEISQWRCEKPLSQRIADVMRLIILNTVSVKLR